MDYVAAAFGLTGFWLIGSKRRIGFLLCTIAQLTWMVVGAYNGLYGLILVGIPVSVVHLRGWFRWGQKGWTDAKALSAER